MKLYRNLCEAVIQSLKAIFEEGKYADKVIEKTLKQNPKWGSRDRRFIAETTYDIVRWFRLLNELTRNSNDYWKLLGVWCIQHEVELPTWKEFHDLHPADIQRRLNDMQPIRAIRESIPDWLDALGSEELPDQWDKELRALNQQAEVVLRTNTLKSSTPDLKSNLQGEGIETFSLEDFPDALVLQQRQNIFQSSSFKDGLFDVQDAGSQAIAPFLRTEPGMRVIDACAGAGGKSLHLAALMKNKGRIIALDTEEWKLNELKKRSRRAGVSIIETKIIDSTKVIKRLVDSSDRVLLDVPCSGLGVLKRNPDAKWKLSPTFLEEVKSTQQKILTQYSAMLKPNGLMVYSTCSILPSENQNQVHQFLQAHSGRFELEEEKTILPSQGFDGFYMARMRKV